MTSGAAETTQTATTRPGTEPISVLISAPCSLLTTQLQNLFSALVMPKPAIFLIGQSLQLANCHQQKTTQMCGELSKSQVSQPVVLTTFRSELIRQTSVVAHLAMRQQILVLIRHVTSQVVSRAVAPRKFVAQALGAQAVALVAICQLQLLLA
jgi:ribosomal protein L11